MNKRAVKENDFAGKKFLSLTEMMQYMSLGRNSAMSLAAASGAVWKAGRRVLINRAVLDRYCETHKQLLPEESDN